MSVLRTVLWGRKNGVRARLRAMFVGDGDGATPVPKATQPGPAVPTQLPRPAASSLPSSVSTKTAASTDASSASRDGFQAVLKTSALRPGEVRELILGSRSIALANVDGDFHAFQSNCPHADGPLGEGTLSGSVLTCPYHGWSYDVTDGSCHTNPEVKLATYATAVIGDSVHVRLSAP